MPDMFDELFAPRDRWAAERDDDFGDDTPDEPEDVWFDDEEEPA